MFVSDCLNVNNLGHLTIGGIDTIELADTYGTPLLVMDEDHIRGICRKYMDSINEYYDGVGTVAYASKAFCCKEMCRIIAQEGMSLDVVSAGELYTALSVDFLAERIYYHGNNKTTEELVYALESKVGRIVVDNIYELELLNSLAASNNMTADIMFRIKPGVEAHTHEFIKTGCVDSKYGFAIETGEAMDAIKRAVELKNINLTGIHCHIGSQIFDIEPFEATADIMTGLIVQARDQLGYEMKELNLGGGYGIQYIPGHDPVEYDKFMKSVSQVVKKICGEKSIKMPFITLEPGRSIVGSSGITLYKVGAIKEIPDIRTYVSVDGGMGDNPRYALYKSEYTMLIANKAGQSKTRTVTVAGRYCESGDLLGENIMLQDVRVGDTLAVLATGAYNYSMASNYNRVPKPTVVMVSQGKTRIIIKRESFDDMIKNDI